MRQFTRPVLVLVAATLSAVLAACDATPSPARQEEYSGSRYPKINLLGDLKNDIAADAPVVTMSATEPMKITIPLRALTHHDLDVQYHFTFLDKDGHQVLPDTGWIYVNLPSSAKVPITGASLDTRATDWFVDIRQGR
jgi:uncharacterized protein YcfL